MSGAARRQTFLYEKETSFGEATSTFGTRLQTLGRIDTSGLTWERENINPTVQRMGEGVQDVRLLKGGTVTTEHILSGHGGTAEDDLTETDLSKLLAVVFGNSDVTASGTTADGTGTAAAFGVNAGGTFPDGTIARLGERGDGRGNGQFLPVEELDGTTLKTLLAPDAAPNENDKVYACQLIYPPTESHDVDSIRARILSANKQYDLHGVFPTGGSFQQLNTGEVPRVSIPWQVAWHDLANATFPDTTALGAKSGAPISGGSLVIQAVGTTTRAKYGLRQFEVEIINEVVQVDGPDASLISGDDHQGVTNAVRVNVGARITAVLDAESTGTNTFEDLFDTDENTAAFHQIMWSGSVVDGRAIGLYFRKCKMVPYPVQEELNELNRVRVVFEAMTNDAGGSALERAPWVLAMG